MLHLITGPAGTGKTNRIYEEIRAAVERREGGRILLVPEQFSHEAERELCRVCGDRLSRYAEVLSFTGLARAVQAELGGGSVPVLDKGGKLLCMALALTNCYDALKVFDRSAKRPEMQAVLLATLDAMKTSCVTPEQLLNAAEHFTGELSYKLTDLALVYESYRLVLGNSKADPMDALLTLSARISDSRRLNGQTVMYIDGFTDFTQLELEVLRELLRRGVDLTVCLTLDRPDSDRELFTLQRRSLVRLKELAAELAVPVSMEHVSAFADGRSATAPVFLAEEVFSGSNAAMNAGGAVELYKAGNLEEECRLAAARILDLTRLSGCRMRDIAMAVRGFDAYAPVLEQVFEEYGVPLYTARRTSMAVRPLPQLIKYAYDIVSSRWRADDVISYLGTGLTGLTETERDLLSQYISRWDLNAAAWHRRTPWNQHPDGYAKEYTDADYARLSEINRIRELVAAPLLSFETATRQADTAAEQVTALYAFLEQLSVPATLDALAERLSAEGRIGEAEEYAQIWEITVSALEQCHAILQNVRMDADAFSALFHRMLSSYDIGSIPASLDSVTAGDFDRMRKRNIRTLLVLGASADRLPAFSGGGKLFSDDELILLHDAGAGIGEHPDNELWREYALIYNCLSLPSERLIITFPSMTPEGAAVEPSILVNRAKTLFNMEAESCDFRYYQAAALQPALKAAFSDHSVFGKQLLAYFRRNDGDRLEAIRKSSVIRRGTLSPSSVEKLYGKSLGVTASRAERYFSCRLSYYLTYGLALKSSKKAVFDASELGIFTHRVLQATLEKIRTTGDFHTVSDEEVLAITEQYFRDFEARAENNFPEKSARFLYLFHRMEDNIRQTVLDTVQELRTSSFTPVRMEFNLNELNARLTVPGKSHRTILISGIVDRIDVWEKDGICYLRIADYKLSGKDFDLSEVYYGRDLQMLLYLYTLCANGARTAELLHLPSAKLRPAGIMYIPAFYRSLSADSRPDEAWLESERKKERKRKGIVLNSEAVLDAWEHSHGTNYIPVKYDKAGHPSGDSLLTEEQFTLLYRHMMHCFSCMAAELGSGVLTANPYRKSGDVTFCTNCSSSSACIFKPGELGENYNETPKKSTAEAMELILEEVENDG